MLDFLVSKHPALFSVEELVREHTGCDDPESAKMSVEEALISLTAYGLVHQIGQFVFATRAAVQGHVLSI